MPSKNAPKANQCRMSSKYTRPRQSTPCGLDTEEHVGTYPSPISIARTSPARDLIEVHEPNQFTAQRRKSVQQKITDLGMPSPIIHPSTKRSSETSSSIPQRHSRTECICRECNLLVPFATRKRSSLEPEPGGARYVSSGGLLSSIKSGVVSTIRELPLDSEEEKITGCGTEHRPEASSPAMFQPPRLEEESDDTDAPSSIGRDLATGFEHSQYFEWSIEETREERLRTRPLTTEQRAHAIHKIQILPSSEVPQESFDLLRLVPELRYQVYDMIALSQTFMVTSQKARGSTFTNLSYTSRVIRQDIKNWAKTRPDLTSGLRGGFVDFNNTIFLVDFWTDRSSIPPTIIGSRFQALSVEKVCAGKLKNLCVDLTTDSQHDGPQAVLAFLRSLHGTLHEFVRLRQLTIVYDSGDESVKSDWFLQRGAEWTGEYERKDGFLRTVWRMLPAALGVCHWCYPCSCCAPSWKIEFNGFDVRKGEWEVLPLEEEMYQFIVADSSKVMEYGVEDQA